LKETKKHIRRGQEMKSKSIFGSACAGVFHVSTARAVTETVICVSKGNRDGACPYTSLNNVDNALYGTTAYGGTGSCAVNTLNGVGYRCGTVYAIKP
jgi:hypothetical protein